MLHLLCFALSGCAEVAGLFGPSVRNSRDRPHEKQNRDSWLMCLPQNGQNATLSPSPSIFNGWKLEFARFPCHFRLNLWAWAFPFRKKNELAKMFFWTCKNVFLNLQKCFLRCYFVPELAKVFSKFNFRKKLVKVFRNLLKCFTKCKNVPEFVFVFCPSRPP